VRTGITKKFSREPVVKKTFIAVTVFAVMNCAVAQDRMPRIPEDKLTDAQKQAIAEIIAGPRKAFIGPFVPMVRSPGLMRPVQKVGEYIRYNTKLDRRIGEMAALMAARQWTQQYEWHGHYPQESRPGSR
jgi:4-carboxymuconolactone decarboxylase